MQGRVGATVVPAGPGQTELQVQAAFRAGTTAYAGTPDFLKVILDRVGRTRGRSQRHQNGGRQRWGPVSRHPGILPATGGISCLQSYATADLGNVAYETVPDEGLIIDEGVIVEIVVPGTGDPVGDGRTGEVVVTTLNPDYPLVRFATGDLSAFLPGTSSCGRTNRRLAGWKGRADQSTKVKGMFVRPEQVAELVARVPEIVRARIVVTRDGGMDVMTVLAESAESEVPGLGDAVSDILNLRGTVEVAPIGSLPDDGKVIDDRRSYD